MKLIDTNFTPSKYGLPAYKTEWWDLGNGYEIMLMISDSSCTISVGGARKDITFEVAQYLGFTKDDIQDEDDGSELQLRPSISLAFIYKNVKKYKEFLKKLEMIVNEHFKPFNKGN